MWSNVPWRMHQQVLVQNTFSAPRLQQNPFPVLIVVNSTYNILVLGQNYFIRRNIWRFEQFLFQSCDCPIFSFRSQLKWGGVAGKTCVSLGPLCQPKKWDLQKAATSASAWEACRMLILTATKTPVSDKNVDRYWQEQMQEKRCGERCYVGAVGNHWNPTWPKMNLYPASKYT